jgi:hypothetical protein
MRYDASVCRALQRTGALGMMATVGAERDVCLAKANILVAGKGWPEPTPMSAAKLVQHISPWYLERLVRRQE